MCHPCKDVGDRLTVRFIENELPISEKLRVAARNCEPRGRVIRSEPRFRSQERTAEMKKAWRAQNAVGWNSREKYSQTSVILLSFLLFSHISSFLFHGQFPLKLHSGTIDSNISTANIFKQPRAFQLDDRSITRQTFPINDG